MRKDFIFLFKEWFDIDINSLFPEIKTEYDYYNAKYGNKEYKLLYRIRQYVKIPNNKVDNYRRLNVRLKHYRQFVNGKVEVAYYRTYAVKLFSLDFKKKYIDKILKRHYEDISHKVENINYNKNKSDSLIDNESIFLDNLSNYYLGGFENENMLTPSMERKHRNKEVIALSGCYNIDTESNISETFTINKKQNKWQINKMSKKRSKTIENNMNKKWRNSFTRKMNLIWSYIPDRNTEFYRTKIREFNPLKPYKSQWLVVYVDNTFTKDGITYKIDVSKEKQYKSNNKGYYDMDKILFISQDGKLKFYDMNGDEVKKENIVKFERRN